jgi:formate transporter
LPLHGDSQERPDDASAAVSDYLRAHDVIGAMATFGRDRLDVLDPGRTFLLAVLAGGFITFGALLSVLLATGIEQAGVQKLLLGLGFSTGFFFVVLSEAVLFTEANVVLPATLLSNPGSALRVARFWTVAWAGNFTGALTVGTLIAFSQQTPPATLQLLSDLVEAKMAYRAGGDVWSWLQVVSSGMLANWLVGMAAFFAFMGRTIIGKFIPVALAVTMFVAAGFQHSPANMAYFALFMAQATGPGWGPALLWNIIPAGIGNMLGGTLFVALPFWWVFRPAVDRAAGR